MEEIVALKLLIAGDHFGEISLIYDCITQASCVSRNYLGLAVLSKKHYEEFIVDQVEWKEELLRHVRKYKDPRKRFILKSVKNIPHFSHLPDDIIHELAYAFELKFYEQGSHVLKVGQLCDRFLILLAGEIEVVTEMEGNEYVVDRLPPGTNINHQAVFIDDTMHINMRSI